MTAMLIDLMRNMKTMVEVAKNVPLTIDKCAIERDQMLKLIEQAINCLPDDIETAKDIVATRDQILEEAHQKADTLVQNATKKVALLINEQEITAAAELQAREILLNAKTKSAEIKKLSTVYCNDSLLRTEENLAVILEEVRNTRKKFNV